MRPPQTPPRGGVAGGARRPLIHRRGAAAARAAHNREVTGSKPVAGLSFSDSTDGVTDAGSRGTWKLKKTNNILLFIFIFININIHIRSTCRLVLVLRSTRRVLRRTSTRGWFRCIA